MAIMPPFQGGEGSSNLLTRSIPKMIDDGRQFATRFLVQDSISLRRVASSSQFFANVYLNEPNQFVKNKLKIKYCLCKEKI